MKRILLLLLLLVAARADGDIRPCDITEYGCCSDGVTTALSKDKDGCPAVELCQMPPVGGMCRDNLPRWFYNSQSNKCEMFVYGGCGGNGNRFDTWKECNMICHHGNETQNAISVEAGSTVFLDCEIPEGITFKSWSVIQDNTVSYLTDDIDGIQVAMNGTKSILTIKALKPENSGYYICEIEQSSNNLTMTTQIELIVTDRGGMPFYYDETTPIPLPKFTTTEKMYEYDYVVETTELDGNKLPESIEEVQNDNSSFDAITVTAGMESTLNVTESVKDAMEKYPATHSIYKESGQGQFDEEVPNIEDEMLDMVSHSQLTDMANITTAMLSYSNTHGMSNTTEPVVETATTSLINEYTTTQYFTVVSSPTAKTSSQIETTTTSKSEMRSKSLGYPRDLRVTGYSEPDGTMKLNASWLPPSNNEEYVLYKIRYTSDPSYPINRWFVVYAKTTTANWILFGKEEKLYFTIQATTSQWKRGPYSPIFVFYLAEGSYDWYSNSCYDNHYGCCDDMFTPASGPNKYGCQEQLTTVMMTTTAVPTTTTTSQRSPPAEEWTPPVNFKITRNAVASDRVSITLSWEDPSDEYPVTSYIVRLSSDVNIPQNQWRQFKTANKRRGMALRRNSKYYFTVAADVAGTETKQSPIYSYSSEDQTSRLYTAATCASSAYGCCQDGITEATGDNYEGCAQDRRRPITVGGCVSTRWGCCSDGRNAASGPDKIGCPNDRQPCDISEYGCCLDGITEATGHNFNGCQEKYGGETGQQSVNSLCMTPKEKGPCYDYAVRWYYDTKEEACLRFWYGGCKGNQNRFLTEQECMDKCFDEGTQLPETVTESPSNTDTCSLPTVVGPCRGRFQRWTYNVQKGKCEEFYYGGCQGNENRFTTPEECESKCEEQKETQDVCKLPKEVGPCYALKPMWYYDATQEICREFYYGGCGGNGNRFPTREDCENQCDDKSKQPQDVCTMATEVGPCRAALPQYSYNSESGKCEVFMYGGCGGNKNRFDDEESCMKLCGAKTTREEEETCELDKEPGPCYGYFIRWYYDTVNSRCDRFIYGGCQGNSNNYLTLEECQKKCVNKQPKEPENQDVCNLEYDTGNCFAYFEKWYFNPRSGSCETFVYGGCAGNGNRFDTYGECNERCIYSVTYTDMPQKADLCSLDRDSGNCDGYDIKWYYDNEYNICRRFVYTGCQGNANRFNDWDECKMTCVDKEVKQVVTTPKPTTVTSTPHCIIVTCRDFCAYGYASDTNGCQTCKCRSPCDNIQCASGYQCKLKKIECTEFDTSCRPITAICELANKPGTCPAGDAITNLDCPEIKSCGVDSDCPQDEKCCWNNDCGPICQSAKGQDGSELISTDSNSNHSERHGATCKQSSFGCCLDGITAATDDQLNDCPESKPEIKNKDKSEYFAAVGTRVTLRCDSIGAPRPTIVWYKNRQPIPTSDYSDEYVIESDGSLNIAQAKPTDTAEYICRAYNGVAEPDYLYISLTVHRPVIITKHVQTFTGKRGDRIVLPCSAEGSPRPTITWSFNGIPVYRGTQADNSLIIDNLSLDKQGEYKCTADNGISMSSRTMNVTISERISANLATHKKSYTEGNTMMLTCVALSYPLPTVEWSKDEQKLLPSDKVSVSGFTLTVQNLTQSDSGQYSCLASNGRETVSASTSIKVLVKVPANCTDRPDLANCALIVKYNYCGHPVYRHFCCKSCLNAGKFALNRRRFRKFK